MRQHSFKFTRAAETLFSTTPIRNIIFKLVKWGHTFFFVFLTSLDNVLHNLDTPYFVVLGLGISAVFTELQISCVFAFFTPWKWVKTHVLSDQSVHITHTYCCVSKLSKFGAYLYSRVHNNIFLSERNSP